VVYQLILLVVVVVDCHQLLAGIGVVFDWSSSLGVVAGMLSCLFSCGNCNLDRLMWSGSHVPAPSGT
jgi:hypothetical protein